MSSRTVLFELGVEELPAGEYYAMADALADALITGLTNNGLIIGKSRVLATPRRLSVLITDVEESAKDTEQTVLGPPISAARNSEGEWTPAAIGFAKKQGIEPTDLRAIVTDKGERLGTIKAVKGAISVDVLPAIVSQAVSQIPVSKRMRWGRERHEFLRPVQWLVLLYGSDTIELPLFGLHASRTTRGHRFHGDQAVELASADAYEETLRAQHVIASVEERKALISAQVQELVSDGECAIVEDDLLNEVAGLVEWPIALRGTFDTAFLAVPRQALISSMREHQKYFHIEDQNGALLPAFITVSNIQSKNPQSVIYGNEKVIRPRLADAAFFFNTDKQTTLASKIANKKERMA